jgi:hypothetical protein
MRARQEAAGGLSERTRLARAMAYNARPADELGSQKSLVLSGLMLCCAQTVACQVLNKNNM